MTTRLRFIFDGGPDDETRTLREVTDRRNNPIVFGHLARWAGVSHQQNIWAMEVDTVHLDRRPIIAISAVKTTQAVRDVITQLSDGGSIVLERARELTTLTDDEDREHDRKLQEERIDIADSLFVINEDTDIPDELKGDISYAEKTGKRVQYLKYAQKTSTE